MFARSCLTLLLCCTSTLAAAREPALRAEGPLPARLARRTAEPAPEIARTKIQASDIQAEGARLEAAILQSRKQLTKLRARLATLPEDSQDEIAPLLDAYMQMLGPSRLVRGARQRIGERLLSAETAVMAIENERS